MNRHDEIDKRLTEAGFYSGYIQIVKRWMDEIGYFIAPSSRTHHGNYEGGNCDHSIAVCDQLVKLTEGLGLSWERQTSPYIVGLFHDLCKCDQYVKNEDTGEWEYNPNMLCSGHGEKSVMILSQMMQLTEEEVLCIRYHMGAYVKEDWSGYDAAIKKYPNVLFTHTADMLASKLEV